MKITVNEEVRELPDGSGLQALLAALGLTEKKGLAVAVNQTVVPAADFSGKALGDGDKVLIIQATQGG